MQMHVRPIKYYMAVYLPYFLMEYLSDFIIHYHEKVY